MISFKAYPFYLAASLVFAPVAHASGACDHVNRIENTNERNSFRAFVTGALSAPPDPAQVTIVNVLQHAPWTIVGAEIPDADGVGYFLYQAQDTKQLFYGIWGGMADPSEAGEVARWATDQGSPPELARCFASIATGG